MIRTGLVSVTFRKLPVEQVIALTAQAHLDGIEWGGDVHTPHGDVPTARCVARQTTDAGLAIAAYGSYYRLAESPAQHLPFELVLDTAQALGAPIIRVWAGTRGSADADQNYWDQVVSDSIRIADLAKAARIGIAYEFHRRTLTDTAASTSRLLAAVSHSNVSTYWQPNPQATPAENSAGLDAVLPRLSHLHVFAWASDGQRQLLHTASENWRGYLQKTAQSGRDHFALLEFVKDDSPETFLQDAQTLKSWLLHQ